jgi:FkbM family methyltransferase
MLIELRHLCNKYKFIPKGVLHIGAHKGEELASYDNLGIENVVWIEGNPSLAENLKRRLEPRGDQLVYNYLVSDTNDQEFDFKITNNGESSSILEMEKHLEHHPHIHVVDSLKLKSKRLDSIIDDNKIEIGNYDFINLDIQGAELLALKGLGDKIKSFKYIYTEVNTGEVYKGCAKIDELDEYLAQYGFERVETKITEYEWGDAFYIKK